MIPHQPTDAAPIGDVDLDLVADGEQLLADIERYLADQAPAAAATAHPLVTATTDQLVAQALGTTPAAAPPDIALPPRWTRILPSWVLRAAGTVTGRRQVTVHQHLELTALLLERYGWTGTGIRDAAGRRCILGAQAALVRLGYGDETTARAAGALIQAQLPAGSEPYWIWNDRPGRTASDALALIRAAAATGGDYR